MSYSKFLLVIATATTAWSNCIVKSLDTNTTISINEKNRTLSTIGEELKLEGNNNVCVSSGKINITCSNKEFDANLTSNQNSCKRVNGDKSYFTYIKEKIKYFIHKQETPQNSSGSRGENNNTIVETIELPKNLKSFIIEDEIWAPTPIKLTIYYRSDKNKTVYTSKNSNLTRFEIQVSSLNSGDRLIITNKYDQKLAEIIVKVKD